MDRKRNSEIAKSLWLEVGVRFKDRSTGMRGVVTDTAYDRVFVQYDGEDMRWSVTRSTAGQFFVPVGDR